MIKKMPNPSARSIQQPPSLLQPWLFCESSLTEKLNDLTGHAHLKLIGHQWHQPQWWDKHVLGIQQGLIFQREILMMSNAVCCWYARTIVPEATYQHNQQFFRRLEQQPLSVLLFQEKRATRHSLAYYATSQQELEFFWVKPYFFEDGVVLDEVRLWVRLASYVLPDQQPFYLIEIFSPQFLDLLS